LRNLGCQRYDWEKSAAAGARGIEWQCPGGLEKEHVHLTPTRNPLTTVKGELNTNNEEIISHHFQTPCLAGSGYGFQWEKGKGLEAPACKTPRSKETSRQSGQERNGRTISTFVLRRKKEKWSVPPPTLQSTISNIYG